MANVAKTRLEVLLEAYPPGFREELSDVLLVEVERLKIELELWKKCAKAHGHTQYCLAFDACVDFEKIDPLDERKS